MTSEANLECGCQCVLTSWDNWAKVARIRDGKKQKAQKEISLKPGQVGYVNKCNWPPGPVAGSLSGATRGTSRLLQDVK